MCSEIVRALRQRGLAPPGEDADTMLAGVKQAVRRLCASDVVCARIAEQDAMQRTPVECAGVLHKLTGGKVSQQLDYRLLVLTASSHIRHLVAFVSKCETDLPSWYTSCWLLSSCSPPPRLPSPMSRAARLACCCRERNTRTHTFNGPLSGTTWVSRYQKGETNLDFTEARDSEWQCHHLGHMQVCISLQTDNHASTPPL